MSNYAAIRKSVDLLYLFDSLEKWEESSSFSTFAKKCNAAECIFRYGWFPFKKALLWHWIRVCIAERKFTASCWRANEDFFFRNMSLVKRHSVQAYLHFIFQRYYNDMVMRRRFFDDAWYFRFRRLSYISWSIRKSANVIGRSTQN